MTRPRLLEASKSRSPLKARHVKRGGLPIAVVGLAGLVALTPGTSEGQGGAQARPPQDVTVINADVNPVPAAIVGTPSVHVSTMPTVTVGGAVAVAPARPYQVSGHQRFTGQSSISVMSQQHTVPAGKDFVATWVSAQVESSEGDTIRRVELR